MRSRAARRHAPAVLDLRGLPPPEPLVRGLESTEALDPGEEMTIVTDRRPAFLLPILHDRGYKFTVHERPDGCCQTTVRR